MAVPPAPQQLTVLGPQYCLPYDIMLSMKEGWSVTGDNMEISDNTGLTHFKLKAKLLSMHDKKVLNDPANQPVCSIATKVMSMHHTMYVCTGGDSNVNNSVAELKKALFHLRPQIQVFLKGNTSGKPDVEVKGSFTERSFKIMAGTMLLAEASRDAFSLRSLVTERDSYILHILPGVDVAFMVAIVICIDDMTADKRHANINAAIIS